MPGAHLLEHWEVLFDAEHAWDVAGSKMGWDIMQMPIECVLANKQLELTDYSRNWKGMGSESIKKIEL